MTIPQLFSPMFRPHRCFAAAPASGHVAKVDGATGRRHHHWSAAFWVTEDQQLGGTHFHSYFFRFSAVVDHREQSNAFRLQNSLKLLACFVDGVTAGYVDDSSIVNWSHSIPSLNSRLPLSHTDQ